MESTDKQFKALQLLGMNTFLTYHQLKSEGIDRATILQLLHSNMVSRSKSNRIFVFSLTETGRNILAHAYVGAGRGNQGTQRSPFGLM
jgi:hypothetical protein